MKKTLLLQLSIILFNFSRAQYVPPIGIPAPSFGINESRWMYANVANRNPSLTYTIGNNGPFTHYIDNSNPSATDVSNPYGSVAIPRLTIPKDLPAGSVVEVHGSTYTYINGPSGEFVFTGTGTAQMPIFIHGDSTQTQVPRFTHEALFGFYGIAKYMIVENISTHRFTVCGPDPNSFPGDSTHHISMRNCEVTGNLTGGGILMGFGTRGALKTPSTDIVVYNNNIHHNGDYYANFDQDVHGVGVGGGSRRVWILENEMSYNSGDGLQVNGNDFANQNCQYIYIGKNVSHHNKQTGMWTKQATHVIFSQNEVYGHKPMGTSPSAWGAGMGFQYGPENVWFLYNIIHNNCSGISTASTSGLGNGTNCYFIGNIIYNNHHDPNWSYTPGSAWANAGMTLVGVRNKYIMNNTIYGNDAGINIVGGMGYVENNIITNVTESAAQHFFHEDDLNGMSYLKNNLFYQGGNGIRIRIGTTTYSLSASNCSNCLNADPLFINENANNFHLQSNSPAIDNGIINFVYSRFDTLYPGVNIRFDSDKNTRPMDGNGSSTAEWDMGAYEYPGCSAPTASLGADKTECTNGSITLNPGGGFATYTWSNGSTASTIQVSTSGNYWVTVTDNSSCSKTDSVNITINHVPNATLVTYTTVCSNASAITLNGSPTGGIYIGSGISGSTFYPSVADSGFHIISYIYTNASGCADTATDMIVVNRAPQVSFAAQNTICDDTPLFSLAGGLPIGGTYSGNGVSSNNFNAIAAGVGTHNITYTYSAANGCSSFDTKTITVNNCTGITEGENFEITVYPNPAHKIVNIASDELMKSIAITTLEGKVVWTNAGRILFGNEEVDASCFAKGMYLMIITTNSSTTTKKLILE